MSTRPMALTAAPQAPPFRPGMTKIRSVEAVRIAEDSRGFLEGDAVLDTIGRRLRSMPLEHDSVYTKRQEGRVPAPSSS